MRRLPTAIAALLLAALGACGGEDAAPPGGATAGEARALDEAAEMIEQRRLPPEAFEHAQHATPAPPTSPAPVGRR